MKIARAEPHREPQAQDRSARRSNPLRFRKRALENLSGGRVDHFVPTDVVLNGDARIGVAEQFGGEFGARFIVDRSGDGAPERVRGDPAQPRK